MRRASASFSDNPFSDVFKSSKTSSIFLFVYLENPRVITVRYSRYDKDEKNFSNYIDKVVKKPSSTAFYLLLCRHSKTSCLRKLHKYVIQQINKFLSHSMKTVVDNTMYKFYDYVIDKY